MTAVLRTTSTSAAVSRMRLRQRLVLEIGLVDDLAAGGLQAVDPALLEFVGDQDLHASLVPHGLCGPWLFFVLCVLRARSAQITWISNPSRSLGSNHVDLGGMISPASDTAIRSATLTGIERERDRRLARIDQPLELAGAARAADEIDPLVGAHVGDLQHRREQPLLQHADVERRRSRSDASGATRGRSVCQPPWKYIAMSPRPAGVGGPGSDIESLAHRSQELVRRQTAEILHRPVVRQDLHLVVRKRDRQHRRASAPSPSESR